MEDKAIFSEIENNPLIYDSSVKGHFSPGITDEVYAAIAKQFNLPSKNQFGLQLFYYLFTIILKFIFSAQAIKTRWRSARDMYRKAVDKNQNALTENEKPHLKRRSNSEHKLQMIQNNSTLKPIQNNNILHEQRSKAPQKKRKKLFYNKMEKLKIQIS